jgi:hypothetical protein
MDNRYDWVRHRGLSHRSERFSLAKNAWNDAGRNETDEQHASAG